MVAKDPVPLLKLSFLVGAVADFAVGVNWLLISLGYAVPNVVASFEGSGADYRFAMYICTLFMFGWTGILIWGYAEPLERRGLLIITASLLAVSIAVELLYFRHIISDTGLAFGVALRVLIISKFTFSYVYSIRKNGWRCAPARSFPKA
jgi:hypothetical protein